MANKNLKVCFIHSYGAKAFENKSVGGTELQLYYLSTRLSKEKEFEVDFITRGEKVKNSTEGCVRILPGIGNTNNFLGKLISGFKILKYMKYSDSDIYFTSSDNMLPGLSSIFCLIHNKKSVHRTVHRREIDGELVCKNPIKGIVHYLGLKSSDLLFVQAKEHRQILSKKLDQRIKVLNNSFPLKKFKKDSNTKKDYFLWVGRRVKSKRPQIFLDLASKLENEKFIMICPATDKNKQFELEIRNNAKDIDNLKFIDYVNRENIQKYFERANVFVNTSEKEGFPNTFIESGIANTPILSLSVNPDNFIGRYRCGVFCGSNLDKLLEESKRLAQNPDISKKLGANCRKYVEEKHSLEKNFVEFKKELLNIT